MVIFMRGKKKDIDFISQFISNCANSGIFSSDDILNVAKQELNKLNTQIIEAENLKITRSKILDLIELFDKKENINNIHLLSKIDLCRFIVKSINLNYKELNYKNYSQQEINFYIKQLIKNQVIIKSGSSFIPGKKYSEFKGE